MNWLDEQVLRQYTKLAKRWEDKGGNIYHLSSALGLPAKALIITGGDNFFGGYAGLGIDFLLYNWDWAYNFDGLMGHIKEQDTTDSTISLDPHIEFYKKVNRRVRLPTLLSGIGLVGKSAYDFVNYFANGVPFDNSSLGSFTLGLGLLSIASSQYLKDRNPKLLDKQPVWRNAYDWIKNKIGSLTPQHVPLPVPVQTYSNLENYVQSMCPE